MNDKDRDALEYEIELALAIAREEGLPVDDTEDGDHDPARLVWFDAN